MMNGMNLGSLFTRGAALTTWQVGIYCRLSKDDDQQGESASIGNQRELLTNYCKAQGWTIAQVYQDVYNQRLIPFDTKTAVQTPKKTAFEGKSTRRKPFFYSLKLYCSVVGFINAPSK